MSSIYLSIIIFFIIINLNEKNNTQYNELRKNKNNFNISFHKKCIKN